MTSPRLSLICATLLRPSFKNLMLAIRAQTFRDYEVLVDTRGPNEYCARNAAAKEARGEFLVFLDDDTTPEPHFLEKLVAIIDAHPDAVCITGPVRGNMWNQGTMTVDREGWFIGCNFSVRRDVFLEHPFEEDWGLGHPVKGWRADSEMGFYLEEKYPGRVIHDHNLFMDHPGPMGSVIQWDVEAVFVARWKKKCMDRFLNDDPRLGEFLWNCFDLTPSEKARVLAARDKFRAQIPGLPPLEGEIVKPKAS